FRPGRRQPRIFRLLSPGTFHGHHGLRAAAMARAAGRFSPARRPGAPAPGRSRGESAGLAAAEARGRTRTGPPAGEHIVQPVWRAFGHLAAGCSSEFLLFWSRRPRDRKFLFDQGLGTLETFLSLLPAGVGRENKQRKEAG